MHGNCHYLLPKEFLGYSISMTRNTAGDAASTDGPKRPPRTVRKVQAKAAPAKRGAARPADDPLAPERTRYVVQLLGSGQKLAGLMGVSPSQPSRWASGDERPSMAVAPLLIDLEHVLARVRLVWSGKSAVIWLESANAYLGGARPIDVLRLQGPGPVLEALDAASWGGAA